MAGAQLWWGGSAGAVGAQRSCGGTAVQLWRDGSAGVVGAQYTWSVAGSLEDLQGFKKMVGEELVFRKGSVALGDIYIVSHVWRCCLIDDARRVSTSFSISITITSSISATMSHTQSSMSATMSHLQSSMSFM